MKFSLNDRQLEILLKIAADIPYEKRGTFLERVNAMLTTRGRWDDDIVLQTAKLAATGLARRPAVAGAVLKPAPIPPAG
jgi:hypothetical protein